NGLLHAVARGASGRGSRAHRGSGGRTHEPSSAAHTCAVPTGSSHADRTSPPPPPLPRHVLTKTIAACTAPPPPPPAYLCHHRRRPSAGRRGPTSATRGPSAGAAAAAEDGPSWPVLPGGADPGGGRATQPAAASRGDPPPARRRWGSSARRQRRRRGDGGAPNAAAAAVERNVAGPVGAAGPAGEAGAAGAAAEAVESAARGAAASAPQTDATSIPHSPRPALADNGTEVDTEVDLSSPGQSSSSSSSSDNITEASDHSPKVITPKAKSASGRVERIPRARNPFKPVTSETYGAYAILAFSLFLFAVGLASNLTVICVVCNNRYMKNVSNSLLANMAFWDFLVIFVCLPLTAVHELSKRWVLGDFTCKLVPYLEVASLGITTFTLAALCLDRFHAATNVRLHYEQTEGCISRGGKLAVVWLGALVLSTPELLIHGLAGRDGVNSNNNNNHHHHHYQDHQNTQQQGVAVAGGAPTGSSLPYDRCEMRVPHELPDFLYMLSATYRAARPWWFFGCYFCLPIAFTVTCSVLTARRMKGAGAAAHNKPPPGEAGPATSLTRGSTRQQLRLERQMNCAVVALATAYACCLVPEIVCSMVWEYAGVGGGESPALDVLHTVAQYLLFSKSCLGPVLLLGLCRELARAARACCCCCCPCPETGGGEGSAEMPSSPAPPGGGGGGAVVALSPCVVTAASDENENERPAGEMELFTFSTVQRELTTFSTA
ncbi:unnamed protein product, partial [Lampetra planeri]